MRSLFLLLAVAAVACGPGYNEMSGKDAKRTGARAAPLDHPIDDRVSDPDGDQTDWKRFTLGGPTELAFVFWWDDPDEVEATVTIRDTFARVKARLVHDSEQRVERLGPVTLGEGEWLLKVEAHGGSSVYTMEIQVRSGTGNRPEF
jgi:hypothetical protein